MKFLTYLMKLRFGSFLANYSISEEKPNPMITDFGLLKIWLSISSKDLLFYKLTKSIKNALLAPLIYKRLGFVLCICVSWGLHSESTPMNSSSSKIDILEISSSVPIHSTLTCSGSLRYSVSGFDKGSKASYLSSD